MAEAIGSTNHTAGPVGPLDLETLKKLLPVLKQGGKQVIWQLGCRQKIDGDAMRVPKKNFEHF